MTDRNGAEAGSGAGAGVSARRPRRVTVRRLGIVAVLIAVIGAVAGTVFALTRPADIAKIGGPGIRSIRLPGTPRYLAFAEGRLWATAHDGKWPMVVSIDPASGRILTGPVRARVPTASEASGLAVGDGSAWMVALPLTSGGIPVTRGFLLRVDPGTGATERITVGHHPSGVAFGFGSAWVTNSDDNTVARVDPVTDGVIATIPVGKDPGPISIGDGRVWVTNTLGSAGVGGIDPTTNRVVVTIPDIEEPAAADGWLWAVGPGRPNGAVVRIDPRTGLVSGPRFGLDIQPAESAAGDHTAWFTEWVENPSEQGGPNYPGPIGWPRVVVRLVRIDPATGRQLGHPITVDGWPTHPLVAGGSVWIASVQADAILRVDFDAPYLAGN